jgi:hypothetical protein
VWRSVHTSFNTNPSSNGLGNGGFNPFNGNGNGNGNGGGNGHAHGGG